MKEMSYYKILACSLLLGAGQGANAQLLKGIVKVDKLEAVQVVYSLDGDMLSNVYQEVTCGADGSFSFDALLPKAGYDASIYVNDAIFGVRLEKGKTAEVRIEQDADGTMHASFGGDNQAASRFYNAYAQAFDLMKYFSIDPEESKTTAQYLELLEKEYGALKKELPVLDNAPQRFYYARLAEGMYQWTYIRILMDDCEKTGKKLTEYPEYNRIMKSIDPNDTIHIPTNLIVTWLLSKQQPIKDFEADLSGYYLESLDIIGKQVTNPEVRRVLTRFVAHSFFAYIGANSDVRRFWAGFKDAARPYPELIAAYEPKMKALLNTGKGAEAPYIPVLTRPDGTTCRLSDLYGKLLYLDIWATWCGPCCKEIPFVEKLAARYKGNENVCIVSISVDHNRNAWLKKLEADKPEWPQYLLAQEEESRFTQQWGIGGIPRFILIGKDGKILNADAPRPSDEHIVETIEENLNLPDHD